MFRAQNGGLVCGKPAAPLPAAPPQPDPPQILRGCGGRAGAQSEEGEREPQPSRAAAGAPGCRPLATCRQHLLSSRAWSICMRSLARSLAAHQGAGTRPPPIGGGPARGRPGEQPDARQRRQLRFQEKHLSFLKGLQGKGGLPGPVPSNPPPPPCRRRSLGTAAARDTRSLSHARLRGRIPLLRDGAVLPSPH